MESKQRILAALEGKKMDRIPILEIAFWPETITRWENEGLPKGISPQEYFKMDKIDFFAYDGSLQFKEETVKEDDETRVYTDADGGKYKAFKQRSVPPILIESKIKEIKDWEKYKKRLNIDILRFTNFDKEPIWGSTLSKSQHERYKESTSSNTFKVLVPTEPCWYFLRLLGEENALMAIGGEPELAEEIMSYYNDFNISMVKEISKKGYKFDAVWVFSDMCYKNGMLFSPKFYKERILPLVKSFFTICKEFGMKVIYHSDGNLKELLPLLIEAGVDCVQPLEVRAGNDVIEYLNEYKSNLSFMGNIDADALASTKENIYKEISSKIPKVKETKRYLFHSDHSIPPTVSLENYAYAIKLAKEFGSYLK